MSLRENVGCSKDLNVEIMVKQLLYTIPQTLGPAVLKENHAKSGFLLSVDSSSQLIWFLTKLLSYWLKKTCRNSLASLNAFAALYVGLSYVRLPRVLIGLVDFLCNLCLIRVISLVLALRHSIENYFFVLLRRSNGVM